MKFKYLLILTALFATTITRAQTYIPSQENLAARQEFSRERFGIFLHWGIYASYAQGEWYLNNGKLDRDEYAKAAAGFYPVNYNAADWAKAFKDSGAEYVTITSRHHDGFSMFGTKASAYNIVDATPFGRDVIKELDQACLEEGLKLQFYYSILDWMRDDYPAGKTGHNAGKDPQKACYDHYFNFMKDQIKELLCGYHARALWFDGYWDHSQDSVPFDWRMEELYTYIHSIQPSCLVGNNHHRMPLEGEDFMMFEKDLPGHNTTGFSEGQEIVDYMPMETCETMNYNWGYSVSDQNYKSAGEIIRLLATCVSMNSNLLLNIGPQADGSLPSAALDRLREIGEWMHVNGESIKGCGPGPLAAQEWGVTTAAPGAVYLHVFTHPGAAIEVPLPAKAKVLSVTSLSDSAPVGFKKGKGSVTVNVPASLPDDGDYVIKVCVSRP